jgi:hypothetical protein
MSSMSLEGQSAVGKHRDGAREFFAYFDESGTLTAPLLLFWAAGSAAPSRLQTSGIGSMRSVTIMDSVSFMRSMTSA